jgi:uncharacterized membrane protein
MTDEEFAGRLEREVAAWQREEVITDSQATAILARYGIAAAEQRRSKVAVALAFLGAILLGIGVIVFFAANWQYIPGSAKLFLIFLAVAASYIAGFHLRYDREGYRGTGNALLFLGSLLYGAALFLIAQGAHLNANTPSLLVLWIVGVLPLAYLLGSQAMVFLALLCAGTALGFYASDWLEGSSAAPYMAAYLAFGVMLYALGALQGAFEKTRVYLVPYTALGLVAMAGALLVLSFPELSEGHSSSTLQHIPLPFLALLALAAVPVIAYAATGARAAVDKVAEAGLLVVMLAVGGLMVYFDTGGGATGAIFTNLLLLALAVGAVALGYWRQITAWVNVGVFVFAVHVLVRYCDWFWKLLPRSGFFIVLGVALLLGGLLLERARRRVLGAMHQEEQA